MAVREVLLYPHPLLKQAARPLGLGDREEIARVGRDLVDTMRAHEHCVGIAAPQLGEPVRMVVVDVTGHPKAKSCAGLLVLVNPEVVSTSGSKVGREGCLSIPDLTANVRRAEEVEVRAHGLAGEQMGVRADAFEARCLLHELDHLDGLLFLDRVDSLKSDIFQRKRV